MTTDAGPPDRRIPIYMAVADRPAQLIGWVGDADGSTMAALLRLAADEFEATGT